MKRILYVGFLLLTSACTMGTPPPAAEPAPTQAPLPTPLPATSTPTLIPTETASPTPAPPPLFFTEEFDAPSPYWEFLQAGGLVPPTPAVENGFLRIAIPTADTWGVGVYNAHAYSNVFVRAKISFSPSGSAGLICRYDGEDGWFEYNLASDGTYSVLLGQWLAEGIAQYQPIVTDEDSRFFDTGSLTGEIGLFCEDGFLRLYVNDTLIRNLDVANYGLTQGGIGVTAASFAEAPMNAVFEWLRVSDK
ncbi:hypothetical protein FBQ99_06720 [Chloroflexi bacterium CFX2]|nr:hypothetical protein [Chloroflexi bacterium CFX2]